MKYLIILFITNSCYADNSQVLGEAVAKQFKLDVMAKQLVDEYVPKSVQSYSSYLIPIQDAVVNKQIKYKWEYNF